MAKRRSLTANPMVRAAVRSAVRAGSSDQQITTDVLSRFPAATAGSLSRIIGQERRRQSAVDRLMAKDFRKRTNLHSIVGCGAGEKVRARIVVQWTDPQTGFTRQYGSTLTLKNTGILGSILNAALGTVVQDAVGRGYQAPPITSGQRSGPNTYRIEYLDCV